MKNLMMFLFLVLLMTACSNPNVYNLKGSADDAKWNGQKVLLYSISDATGLLALDSTVVENNVFSLKGEVDTSGWYLLMVEKEGEQPIYKDFFVGEKLNCAIKDSRIRITGNEVNDAYQAFEDQYMVLTADLIKLNEIVKANPADEAAKTTFNTAYGNFQNSFRLLSKKTIEDNMSNALGLHVFQAALPSLDNSDVESILAKASPEFLKDKTVKMVKEQMEMSTGAMEGAKCPDLIMKSPEGTQVALSQFVGNGHYVLIDFWASWCAPCMRELPNVIECYKLYHPKGFDIVGVSLDEDAAAWKAAIKNNKISWPQMSDLAGWKSEAVTVFSFTGIPHTVLVDPNGVIVAKNLRGDGLKLKLAELYK